MKNAARRRQIFLLVLALLICNAAAGLASRLAGGLALAATALNSAVAQVTGLQSLDSFHNDSPILFVFLRRSLLAWKQIYQHIKI